MRTTLFILSMLLLIPFQLRAQEPGVTMRVDASAGQGAFKHVWSYFGYDEPNFTYAENGKKLLSELNELSPVPVWRDSDGGKIRLSFRLSRNSTSLLQLSW